MRLDNPLELSSFVKYLKLGNGRRFGISFNRYPHLATPHPVKAVQFNLVGISTGKKVFPNSTIPVLQLILINVGFLLGNNYGVKTYLVLKFNFIPWFFYGRVRVPIRVILIVISKVHNVHVIAPACISRLIDSQVAGNNRCF
jgi:hypothetical protein